MDSELRNPIASEDRYLLFMTTLDRSILTSKLNRRVTVRLNRLLATNDERVNYKRDYQELKQEFGLNEYEGRNWRGFHHHASLCIATYGFLVRERLRCGGQKKIELPKPAVPGAYQPRGTPEGSAANS